ncbi:MAG: phospholipase D family protein [Clostridia bacterium]|nr:phospholipase D family protein [Clostridia bacterium]
MIHRCITWIKKHPVLSVFFLILMYLVIGAVAPFCHYKPISPETKERVSAESFYQEGDSWDRAMILETNQSAWDEWMRLMNLARERIILSTFDFRDGESPRDLMAVMLHKADQGVSIKILVDGFSGLVRMEPCKLFYALSSHPNIEIRIYNKMNPLLPWKTQGRMHDKYVIVDDYGYILGGRNTFDYFIGSYPTDSRSHDWEVLVYNTAHGTDKGRDSSLYQVEDYFEQVWNLDVSTLFHDSQTAADRTSVRNAAAMLRERYKVLAMKYPELLDSEEDSASCSTLPGQPGCPALPVDSSINDDDYLGAPDYPDTPDYPDAPDSALPLFPAFPLTPNQSEALEYYEASTVPTGKITLVSNPTGIYGKEPVVFHTMSVLMKNAKRSVLVHTPYAVFNDYMYDTMREITSRVPVTMMINSVENGDNFFASSDYPMHRDAFLDTGMEILEYDGGLSYHGKSLVIDGELCAVGSYNFDLRSTYLDTELMLVIQSRELSAQLEEYMVSYQKDCRRLLPDGTYEIPEHLTIADVPAYKRAAWKVVGFVMQPFRFLI